MQATGSAVCDVMYRIGSRMCSGPVEQLNPMMSTWSDFEDREHRCGIGAEQHPAGDVEGHRGHDRHGTARGIGSRACAEHGGLCFEDVLLRLDDQHVDASLDERRGLLLIHRDEVGKPEPAHRRVTRCGQEPGRPHAAGDKALTAVLRILVGDPPREPCRGDVQVDGGIALTPLLEARPRCLKGARLDDVAACVEEAAVDALDDLGSVDGETVHPSFQRGAAEVVDW